MKKPSFHLLSPILVCIFLLTGIKSNHLNAATSGFALSGTYTIGGTSPDYATFSAAISDLISAGISGPVEFNVRDGVYAEQITIPEITGSSSVNTITFQSESGDSSSVTLSNPSATVTTDNYTMQINGADNLIFRQMTFERSGTGTASTVVEITNQSDNILFTGNQFVGPSSSTTSNTDGSRSGIFSPINFSNNNLVVTGNYFKNNANGMWVNGETSTHATGMIIENNVFENFYVGIFALYQEAPQVLNNIFTRNTSSSTVDYYAISIRFTSGPLLVSKNRINSFTGNYGIRFRECLALTGNEGLCVNNFVQVGGSSISRGISLEDNCTFLSIYNNSVNATGTSSTLSRAFNLDGATTSGIILKNNSLANSGGGYASYISDVAQGGLAQSDYNCLYSTGSTGYWTSMQSTLAAFQSASGLEANSVSGDPMYTSSADLHTTAAILDGAATPLASVSDDIDGDLRDLVTPDIGADEFMSTGINSPKFSSGLFLYPNPASNDLKIEQPGSKSGQAVISVYDICGKLISEKQEIYQAGIVHVDINHLENGFYILKMNDGESIYSGTFVKSRKGN